MGSTMFDKLIDAVKTLGFPLVIAGVLLYFMLTEFREQMREQTKLMHEQTDLMMQGRQTQMEMRAAQMDISHRVDVWMQRGCQPTPPQ